MDFETLKGKLDLIISGSENKEELGIELANELENLYNDLNLSHERLKSDDEKIRNLQDSNYKLYLNVTKGTVENKEEVKEETMEEWMEKIAGGENYVS